MTDAMGIAFETKSAAPAASARSRASRVSMLESTIIAKPVRTVGRTPTRAAMKPPGRPPTNVPIG